MLRCCRILGTKGGALGQASGSERKPDQGDDGYELAEHAGGGELLRTNPVTRYTKY